MAKKVQKSIEEKVEDWCKRQLSGNQQLHICSTSNGKLQRWNKSDSVNPEIDQALLDYPSKEGKSGGNRPDIKAMITTLSSRCIPVMIEVKGAKGDLIKADKETGLPIMTTKTGNSYYPAISRFAVNGALHYSQAILSRTESYKEVIAVGVNGFPTVNGISYEVEMWYISTNNLFIPKLIGRFDDLSLLLPNNQSSLIEKIDNLGLTDEEIEQKKIKLENDIEVKLKALNQKMQDEAQYSIQDDRRVQLITGLVMAGLGVPSKGIAPLRITDLRGESGKNSNDGQIILNKIEEFLTAKELPQEKISMVLSTISIVFLNSNLQNPTSQGESKLRSIYREVKDDIIPFLTGELHNIDFTGKLFNALNEWIKTPDGDKNDVVLTPRYVTELMTKLCRVNMNSFVWDFTLGSGGFLISAMQEMIKDAKAHLSGQKLQDKITNIKKHQLLGIEKLADIYILAVLNMILMKDGSANIIQADSLTGFSGNYEQGEDKGKPFPANVFLLNPPYSREGKGMIFVERALSMMTHGGMAAVLIMESAGTGKGLPYTENILKNNTLVASIYMADIFKGRANVQTCIYLFRVGIPHNVNEEVRFIDASNDGYTRGNRRKASQSVNLKDTDHATERYDEILHLALYGPGINNVNLNYYKDHFITDHITLSGKDWNYRQHLALNTTPQENDFFSVVSDFIDWRVKNNMAPVPAISTEGYFDNLKSKFLSAGGSFKTVKAFELFEIKGNPQLDKESFVFGKNSEYPYFTRTVNNNGILGYVDQLDDSHLIKGNSLAIGMMGMKFFYMNHDFYAGQFTKTAFPLFDGFNEKIALWFISVFNKSSERFKASAVRDFEKLFKNTEILIPVIDGKICTWYIYEYIECMQMVFLNKKKAEYEHMLKMYQFVIDK